MVRTKQKFNEQLMQIIRKAYQSMDDGAEIAISPALLAQKAYDEIDPSGESPALVQYASVMQLRQLARGVCRAKHEEEEESLQQDDLFAGKLQHRYPAHRGGEEHYVLREHLTGAEYEYNWSRLRAEGNSKLAHAKALESDYRRRKRRGDLTG